MTSIRKAFLFMIALSLSHGVGAAQAKITRDQAEATALKLVPRGSLLSGSLEKSKGRLTWWFDFSMPGTRNVKVIQIDAVTGVVVSNTMESPVDR